MVAPPAAKAALGLRREEVDGVSRSSTVVELLHRILRAVGVQHLAVVEGARLTRGVRPGGGVHHDP